MSEGQGGGEMSELGRRRGLVARFVANRRGVTAIEFGVLIFPFSLLLFAILETCISFAGQQVLANAADDVARQIRTGQIKAANLSEVKLKQLICADLDAIVASGCPGLVVDLRQYATFAEAANVKIKYTADHDIDTTGFAVAPGPSMSKNMLRVFYKWPVMIDFMRKYASNLKGGKTLHFASVTWQNEPFND
jgi:Flp pilus assembly protein TadG